METVESVKVAGKCSNVRAVLNLLLSAIGCGLVSLPAQFAATGLTGGILAMTMGVFVANYALMKLWYAIESQGIFVESYEHLALILFGRRGRIVTGVVVHGTIGACAAGLLILIGKTLSRLFEYKIFSSIQSSIFFGSLPLLPLAWLRNMHQASYVALVGTCAVFALVVIILIAGLSRVKNSTPDLVSGVTGSVSSWLMAVSVCVFSFNTANTAPSLIHDMKNPKYFHKTVIVAAILIYLIYMAISLSGYFGWGNSIADYDTVIDLVLSVPSSESQLKQLDTIGFACAFAVLALAYPHYVVLFVPVASAVQAAVGGRDSALRSAVLRSVVFAVTVGFAVGVKNFGDVVEIVAGIAMPLIALIFPIGFYWKTKIANSETISDKLPTAAVFALGLALLSNGLYAAVRKLF